MNTLRTISAFMPVFAAETGEGAAPAEEAKTEAKAADKPKKDKPAEAKAKPAAKDKKAAPAKGKADKKPAKADKKAAAKKADKKPAKAKSDKPKKPAVEKDQFGFRKDSKKSEAAKLYASKKGATLAEVKEKTGSSQLNLLKELEGRKFKITKTKEGGKGKKQVTRYKIVTKEAA